jgi:RNA polymerase sigma factor (sigma-70 family)
VSAGNGGPKRHESADRFLESAVEAPSASNRAQELAEICRNHHAALVRFLAVRIGSVEDAKELVQEAYAKVLALDRPGTMSLQVGYLWRIAVNLGIDRSRERVSRERSYRSLLSLAETLDVSAEVAVEGRERLEVLERAIQELPPKCVEAFVLHVLRGLTFDEVGREMRISGRMARKYLARALEHLQTCLEEADATGGLR